MKFAILTGTIDGTPKIIAGPTTDVDGLKSTMKSILDAAGKYGEGKKEVVYESVAIDRLAGRNALKKRKC
jgi:hypothetical protein